MKPKVLLCAVVVFTLLGYQNCGSNFVNLTNWGTITGNALVPPNNTAAPNAPVMGTQAAALVTAICARLNQCFPSSNEADCMNQLGALPGLPQAFGLPASSGFSTLDQGAIAESQGMLNASPANASACIADLQAAPCTNTNPVAAYSPTTNSYAGVPAFVMLIPVCATVY